MRQILLPILMAVLPLNATAQSLGPTQARPAPAEQWIDTAVVAVSARTSGRLRFWIRLPDSPPKGTAFWIDPSEENPWGASGVMSLLMASYQTQRPVRIFYKLSSDPQTASEIVRVDTLPETTVGTSSIPLNP